MNTIFDEGSLESIVSVKHIKANQIGKRSVDNVNKCELRPAAMAKDSACWHVQGLDFD